MNQLIIQYSRYSHILLTKILEIKKAKPNKTKLNTI